MSSPRFRLRLLGLSAVSLLLVGASCSKQPTAYTNATPATNAPPIMAFWIKESDFKQVAGQAEWSVKIIKANADVYQRQPDDVEPPATDATVTAEFRSASKVEAIEGRVDANGLVSWRTPLPKETTELFVTEIVDDDVSWAEDDTNYYKDKPVLTYTVNEAP